MKSIRNSIKRFFPTKSKKQDDQEMKDFIDELDQFELEEKLPLPPKEEVMNSKNKPSFRPNKPLSPKQIEFNQSIAYGSTNKYRLPSAPNSIILPYAPKSKRKGGKQTKKNKKKNRRTRKHNL